MMQLSQKLGVFKGRLSIRVGSDNIVYLDNEKFLNKHESKFQLDDIDPCFENIKEFSLLSAAFTIIFIILSVVLCWYGTTYLTPPDDGIVFFFSIAFFIVAFISAIKAFKSKINLIRFKSNSGKPLFNILGNKPSESEAKAFSKYLANRIEGIRYNGDISSERMSEILEKHVTFLHEQGVLDEKEVHSALEKIKQKAKINVVNMTKFNTV